MDDKSKCGVRIHSFIFRCFFVLLFSQLERIFPSFSLRMKNIDSFTPQVVTYLQVHMAVYLDVPWDIF